MKHEKSRLWLVPSAVVLGVFAGVIIWGFLKLLQFGTTLIWDIIPNALDFYWYPLAICVVGGVIIGLWRKKFGNYPEECEDVIEIVKETKRYSPHNVWSLCVSSLLPLVFGASVGPEAGLSGIIAGLCTYVGDRFKYISRQMKELTEIGAAAALSILFKSPLFGFMVQAEGEEDTNYFPGRTKVIVYLAAILGGLGAYYLLTTLLGGGLAFEKFDENNVGSFEYKMFIPLAIVGLMGGFLHNIFSKFTRAVTAPFGKFPVITTIIGGIILGICAMFLPLVMFSGDIEMTEVAENWQTMLPVMLFATGIIKLLMINICFDTGWRGGHIIPVIFAGTCIACGMAAVTGVDAGFAVSVISTVMVGAVLHKPIAVIIVMMIFFPVKSIIVLTLSALIGTVIPIIRARRKGRGGNLPPEINSHN